VERVSTPEDLATRFPFHHVLVDEFQDTDTAQIRFIDTLVAALRKGGLPTRLFTVGDPKQSIYRFRSAEVDLFEERCEGGRAKVGHLTTCFPRRPAARGGRAPQEPAGPRLLFEGVFAHSGSHVRIGR
jgi:superfamily I DNA/RNA helicase